MGKLIVRSSRFILANIETFSGSECIHWFNKCLYKAQADQIDSPIVLVKYFICSYYIKTITYYLLRLVVMSKIVVGVFSTLCFVW